MSNRRNPELDFAPLWHPDHPRPVTRRQFLAQGLIAGSAFVIAPSLVGLLRASAARADVLACDVGFSPTGRIPFVVFDLAGGANTAGSNVLVGKQGGQLDLLTQDGYSLLGTPPAMNPISNA